MTLKLIKEIIIILLMTLATILFLTVILSDFIPSNTYVPQSISYVPSDKVKEELQKVIEDKENTKVILTREITESDLRAYQRNHEYTPGKVNPFSSSSGEQTDDSNSTSGTNSTSNTSTNSVTGNNSVNSNNSTNTNTTNNTNTITGTK
ncbi:hypothetical protein D3C72_1208720 [compost metagenome]